MTQASILEWVKAKKSKPKRVVSGLLLRFLISFPEGIMTPSGPVGPFREGDLVNLEVVGDNVARVLIERGAVEVFAIDWRGRK